MADSEESSSTPKQSSGASGSSTPGAVISPKGANVMKTPTPVVDLGQSVPVAVNIGWTMALIYGHLDPRLNESDAPPLHMPTEHELDEVERVNLELNRLDSLLKQLAASLPLSSDHPLPADASVLQTAWAKGLGSDPSAEAITGAKDALRVAQLQFNVEILTTLGCTGRELALAYQLGRSIRDTANPTVSGDRNNDTDLLTALNAQLSRQRISKVQDWLAVLSQYLPVDSATIVSTSMGRWSEFSFTVLHDSTPGQLKNGVTPPSVARGYLPALLDQGDVWLNLLTGTESTAGLLTPESYVAAGEASLSRTARIIRRIIRHYWFLLVIVVVALGGILWISALYLGGASKVWTQIAAIVSALGVTAKGIGSSISKLSEAAERPIYQAEKLDAMAWAVTTLPTVTITGPGVRALRRSGIQRSSSLGRA